MNASLSLPKLSKVSPKAQSKLPAEFLQSLIALEEQLTALANDLLAGDAINFELHCAILQQRVSHFSQVCQTLPKAITASRAFKDRLAQLGGKLTIQRENMTRRAVAVERELQVILPTQPSTTYGKPIGGYSASGRSLGRFASVQA